MDIELIVLAVAAAVFLMGVACFLMAAFASMSLGDHLTSSTEKKVAIFSKGIWLLPFPKGAFTEQGQVLRNRTLVLFWWSVRLSVIGLLVALVSSIFA